MNKPYVVLGALLFLVSQAAFAVDSKIHPGSFCQAYFGNQESNLQKGAGWVKNTSTSTMWVTCPVVRDNTVNSNGISAAYLRVNRASTAASPIFCYFDNRSTTGVQSNFNTNSYNGVGSTSIYFNINASNSRGHYEFLCRLPRDSAIYNYRVDEH